jgi:AcrR family transcriptional regulator
MIRKDTETEILKVATQVFLKKGFDGTKTQDIADKAGINKALLHYYFKTKEQLYERVLESVLRTLMRQMRETLSGEGTFPDVLKRFIDTYIDNFYRNPDLPRFLVWELQHGGKTAARCLKEEILNGDIESLPFWNTYKNAIETGVIRPYPPVHIILNLISMSIYPMLAAPVVEQVFPGCRVRDPEFIALRKQLIFECTWRGIAGSNAPREEI